LNTRAKRLPGRRLRGPFEPPRDLSPNRTSTVDHPGELVGIDCFFVGRLHGAKGPVWQITAIDCYSSYAWADLVVVAGQAPSVAQTSRLARRVAAELKGAGWRLERVLTDNGNEFGRRELAKRLPAGTLHSQIRSGRPQTNGHVERLQRTILEECWRPAFARFLQSASAGCAVTSPTTCTTTTSTANTTDESPTDGAPPTSSTLPARWSRDEPHLSHNSSACSP
jgi:transposase InsO family protein